MDRARVVDGARRRLKGLPAWARWAASPYPPGHYHSPLPDVSTARLARETENPPDSVAGVDTRLASQLSLLEDFGKYYADIPFGQGPRVGLRYHLDCKWFAHGDGVALYSMLRHLKPARYLEIGSGWSSACALDTAQLFLDNSTSFTFVEPNAQRLRSVLRPSDDRVEIIEDAAAATRWETFEQLRPGDVLFIDSSHVVKQGSEVNALFLDIVPRLKPGVHIHVHDIFWPFSYPIDWLEQGRAWNEAYLLRAWLCDNPRARITWFNSYLRHAAHERVASVLPAWRTDAGSSIWIETV